VSKGFYDKARPGRPITLSLWRGDVVAVEAAGGTERFLPSPVWRLVLWLFAAHAGLGVVLWGLLADRSHRRTPFFEYAFVWMLLGALLAFPAMEFLAYGWGIGLWRGVLFGAITLVSLVFGAFVIRLRR